MTARRMRPRIAAAVPMVLVGTAGLLTIAAFGGFDASPARRLPQLTAGRSVDAGQWRVRPLRAWSGDRCPLDGASAPPSHCLSVELELSNLTRASTNDVAQMVRLVEPALPAGVRPDLELVRDRARLGYLHPRLPERVVMSWKLPAAAPRTVTFTVWAKRFKERDNLLGGEGWFDPKAIAEVRLPVGDSMPAGVAP